MAGLSFGKSKNKSKNLAFPFMMDKLGGSVDAVGSGISRIDALLGGDTTGFDAYKNATGFNSELSEGLSDVTNAGAAKGLLRSGSTGKALMNYGQELQQRTAGDYIKNLLGIGQLGLGAAGAIGATGATSKGKSKNLGLGMGGGGGG